jgi:DNA repair protein RadC
MADTGYDKEGRKMHEGHRNRMIEKLQEDAKLAEHELLEILLFNAIPRTNTNPIAHTLLSKFGDIRGIFDAEIEELEQVKGLGKHGAAYLKVVGSFYDRYFAPSPEILPAYYSKATFYRYLSAHLQNLRYEIVEFYSVDQENVLSLTKTFTERNERCVDIEPQEVTKVITEINGKSLILVHNHVGGSNKPSAVDDRMTKQCEILCSINNVIFVDHIIYSEQGIYSYYENHRMSQITRNYHISNLLEEQSGNEGAEKKEGNESKLLHTT